MELFKFEIKKQLKSVLFWVITVFSLYTAVNDSLKAFELPFLSNDEAYKFLTNTCRLGDYNFYHVKLSDITRRYNKQVIESCDLKNIYRCYAGNYKEWLQLTDTKDEDVHIQEEANRKIKEALGNARFSQAFFKILAVCFQRAAIILIVLFSNTWVKDISIRLKDMVGTRPIKSYKYLLSKFMARFLPFISIMFFSYFSLGVIEKIRLKNLNFEFRLSDMFVPFFVFTLLPLLFSAIFCSSVSVLLKNPFTAGPLLIFGMSFGYSPFISGYDAIIASNDEFAYIPPVNLNRGFNEAMVFLIFSLLLFYLACYVWKRSGNKVFVLRKIFKGNRK